MNRHDKRSVIGYLNRKQGGDFEDTINAACAAYRRQGVAIIDKTPEPMRVIQSLGNGKFLAIFTKKAQPDYKGISVRLMRSTGIFISPNTENSC